jgi:hypothetical protein
MVALNNGSPARLVHKEVVGYVYAIEKFSSTCMPRTRSSLTYMPFWMDRELTEVLEGV